MRADGDGDGVTDTDESADSDDDDGSGARGGGARGGVHEHARCVVVRGACHFTNFEDPLNLGRVSVFA